MSDSSTVYNSSLGTKPDHDTMMRLIRRHFNEDAQRRLTFTRWKDGIDIQYPTYAIEAFYSQARNEAIEECARVAENACLVPPDGGSPSPEETEVAAEAARRIRALKS